MKKLVRFENSLLSVAIIAVLLILIAFTAAHAAPQIKVGGTSDDCEGYFTVFKDLFREKLAPICRFLPVHRYRE